MKRSKLSVLWIVLFINTLPVLTLAELVEKPVSVGGKESGSLSLQEALSLCVENNPRVLEAKKKMGMAEARVVQSRAYPNPEIDLSSTGLLPEVTGSENAVETEVQLQQEVEISGTRHQKRLIAEAEVGIARENWRNTLAEIKVAVKEKYWALQLAQKKSELAAENVEYARKFLNQVELKYRSGKTTLAEVIRARLELTQVENDLIKVRKIKRLAEAEINTLLNRSPVGHFEPADEFTYIKWSYDQETILTETLQKHPELSSGRLRLIAAEKKLALAKAGAIPNPRVTVGSKIVEGKSALIAGLSFPLPLWYRNQGEIDEAIAEAESVKAEVEALEKEISLELYRGVIEMDNSASQVDLLKNTVQEVTELLRIAGLQYQQGKSDFLTYLGSLTAFRSKKLDYFEALYNYYVRQAEVQKYLNLQTKTE